MIELSGALDLEFHELTPGIGDATFGNILFTDAVEGEFFTRQVETSVAVVLSVIVQGFLVGRLTKKFRDDVLITFAVALMTVSLLGWALAPSVFWLLVVLTPTSLSGGILNTLLSSTLTKAVAPDEIGGILGLATSIESSTRIIAPILGGALLDKVGTWSPGAFGAIIMAGVTVYVFTKIFNHPIVINLREQKLAPVPVAISD